MNCVKITAMTFQDIFYLEYFSWFPEMCKATKDAAELMKITDPNYLKQFEKKLIIPDAKSWATKHEEFMKKGYLEKASVFIHQ